MSCSKTRHAHDVHVGVDRLLGDLLRCGEQRADIDVEAHVGERRDDDLLTAIVTVLSHLGDQDARATPFGLLERLGGVDDLLDVAPWPASVRYTPEIVRITAW